jgi:hypothetical protein
MVERLQRAVAHVTDEAHVLPEELQNALADKIDALAQEIAARHWDALLSDPRSDVLLEQVIAEARAEFQAGETMDLDDFLAEEEEKDAMTTIYWGISHLFISEEGRDRIRFDYNLMRQPFDAGDDITIAQVSAAQIPPEIQAQVRAWVDQEWEDPDATAYVHDSGMYWLVVTGPHSSEILRQRLDAFLFRTLGMLTASINDEAESL